MSKTDQFLQKYSLVENNKPVLKGHICYKLHTHTTLRKAYEWANEKNRTNNFPPITFGAITLISKLYRNRNKQNFSIFEEKCEEVAKFMTSTFRPPATSQETPATSQETSATSQETSATSQETLATSQETLATSQETPATSQETPATSQETLATSQEDSHPCIRIISELQKKIERKDKKIAQMSRKIKKMDQIIEKLKKTKNVKKFKKLNKSEKKILSRKLHYECLLIGVAANHVGEVLNSTLKRLEINIDDFYISSRTTIGRMLGELGYFSDLQTTYDILNADSCTIMFDSTTQDGMHVNCVIITTPSSAHLISLKQLPGGTAQDYTKHVCDCIENLSEVYAVATSSTVADTKNKIISKIKCCLTDRAPVNHLTVFLLEKQWNTELVELNCNLHPLEAVSHKVRKEMRLCEVRYTDKDATECQAWRLIVGINSLRYKDRLGNVQSMIRFLTAEKLSKTYLTRYRGNRLHVMFHLGFIYFSLFEKIKKYIIELPTNNETLKSVKILLREEAVINELQILAILGKMLSGPWMTKFYTKLSTEENPINTMKTVQNVISNVQQYQDPMQILSAKEDFFNNRLEKEVIEKIMVLPQNPVLFQEMLTACLKGIVEVLQRQYSKSFDTVEASSESVLASVRQHTMLAESVIGEFCEKHRTSPSAYVSSISNVVKAKRNRVMQFIDGLGDDEFAVQLNSAQTYSRKLVDQRRQSRDILDSEIFDRLKMKQQKTEDSKRNGYQRKLKKLQNYTSSAILNEFPNLEHDVIENIQKILTGGVVGKLIQHTWTIDSVEETYEVFILSFSDPQYKIYYLSEEHEDEIYELNKFEFGTDYIMQDLIFF